MEINKKIRGLHSQVAERLGMQIINGSFVPGEPFPVESELCVQLGVSRTTLREAIKNLAAKGLVTVGPSVGTRVRPPSDWNLLDRDALLWRIQIGVDEQLIHDIYEMRECFEPRASMLVAQRGSADDHAKIRAAFNAMVLAEGNPQASADADTRFHVCILGGTGNAFLASLSSVVEAALRVSFQVARQRHPLTPTDIARHKAIVDRITERDAQGAYEATSLLLSSSKEIQLRAFKTQARKVRR